MLDRKSRMINLLRSALLESGPLSRIVYENALEDNIDRWHIGIQIDDENYLFAVAEMGGEIAMVLVESNKRLYINEAARQKLADLWTTAYRTNLENLIPIFAEDLADGALSVTAVRHVG